MVMAQFGTGDAQLLGHHAADAPEPLDLCRIAGGQTVPDLAVKLHNGAQPVRWIYFKALHSPRPAC